jgi:hypothetical protein
VFGLEPSYLGYGLSYEWHDRLSRHGGDHLHRLVRCRTWDGGIQSSQSTFNLHIRDGMELGIVLPGREDISFGDLVLERCPGDVWLCPMWEPHGFRFATSDTCNLVLIFLPQFVADEFRGDTSWLCLFAARPGERPRVRSDHLRQVILTTGADMRREVEEQQEGWLRVIQLGVARLLFELTRTWQPTPAASQGISTERRSALLTRVMPELKLSSRTSARRVTVEEAAAACHLNRSLRQHYSVTASGLR